MIIVHSHLIRIVVVLLILTMPVVVRTVDFQMTAPSAVVAEYLLHLHSTNSTAVIVVGIGIIVCACKKPSIHCCCCCYTSLTSHYSPSIGR